MFNHSHIRQFSSVFVSLRDFQLITQNSSENIASRQSRSIYVNGSHPSERENFHPFLDSSCHFRSLWVL